MAFGLVFSQTNPNQTNPDRIWSQKDVLGLVLVLGHKNRTEPLITQPARFGLDLVRILSQQ
jgi:hypothetical protein